MRFHPLRLFFAGFPIAASALSLYIFAGCSGDDTAVTNVDSGAADGSNEGAVVDAGVVGFANATKVVAGDRFSCALTTDGKVACWGGTSAGENGTTTPSAWPIEVAGLPPITALAAGARHVCAIDHTTKVWCWGDDSSGQLGSGASDGIAHPPALVQANGGPFSGASAIFAGPDETCATDAKRNLFCWGGAFACDALDAEDAGDAGDAGSCVGGISPAAGVSFIRNIAVDALSIGEGFACAIGTVADASAQSVSCWGNNHDDLGALLVGAYYATPQNVPVDGFVAPKKIASGTGHTCVADISGIVDCWGKSDDFSVGVSDDGGAVSPVTVAGFASSIDVAAAGSTTCVRLQNESVACIGNDDHGQLGVGSGPPKTAMPAPVKNLGLVESLAVGATHGCAIGKLAGDGNASVVCWGANADGELGDGTTNDSNVPVHARAPAR